MFLESTQNQRCFNVEFYGWINVDKSTLNQRGYQVDRRHNAISTYINLESTLSVCWGSLLIQSGSNNRKKRDVFRDDNGDVFTTSKMEFLAKN